LSADANTRADELIAQVETNNQARRAVGIARDYIARGRTVVPKLGSLSESALNIGNVISGTTGDLQAQATSLLDDADGYATGVQATTFLNDDPIEDWKLKQVTAAIHGAMNAFQVISEADADLSADFLDALEAALKSELAYIGERAVNAAKATMPVWLPALAAIAIGYFLVKAIR